MRYRARVFGGYPRHTIATQDGESIQGLQYWADGTYPNLDVTIRAFATSDGTEHPDGNGRMVSWRENGKWIQN